MQRGMEMKNLTLISISLIMTLFLSSERVNSKENKLIKTRIFKLPWLKIWLDSAWLSFLNLARRQGWTISSRKLTMEQLKKLKDDGASHITGSLNWHNTYTPMQEAESKRIRQLIRENNTSFAGASMKTYLIPIKDLMP